MRNERLTRKAFTLVELVVSIAMLTIVVSFAGVAFKAGIDSHRVTMANAEIMQKLRAITDQLNADFKGIIERPSGKVFFQLGPQLDGPLRGDRIAFFTNGDFQSTGQYDGKPVVGNVAAVFYGSLLTQTLSPRTRRQKLKRYCRGNKRY
jgi:prepilin-type N-terminal cleavage/methylation domain-containing protein